MFFSFYVMHLSAIFYLISKISYSILTKLKIKEQNYYVSLHILLNLFRVFRSLLAHVALITIIRTLLGMAAVHELSIP
jgi:hypothetical protein